MSDALDRLKKRSRPKVAPRDASLSSSPDIQISRHTTGEALTTQDFQTTQIESPTLPDTSRSRHTELKTSEPLGTELQTKRSTFRMESGLIDRLHSFCRSQGLSREVLIEAMYEYMESHPEAMKQVVTAASQKHNHRQQMANRKRAEAMMQKFGGT